MNKNSIVELANEVLKLEILGAKALPSVINENFIKAVYLIAKCKGKVIISGVGKSGHIGNKISSTMSSIGIPSFFMHPSEASHGDLGMIQKEDILILLSNSGETKEFSNLINFMKTENISSISITRSDFSTLSNAASIKIVIPAEKEALSYGAPTTSTTQTLIIGDMLSVCASKLKGFESKDYAKIHPGGKLGLSLTLITTVMRKREDILILNENATMQEVMERMFSGFAIIEDKNKFLKGFISDGDIRRGILKYGNILELKAKQIMVKTPRFIKEEEPLIKAMEVFNETKIGTLIVLNKNNQISGSIDRKDLMI